MAEIGKITLPNGITYDIKDATARVNIASAVATETSRAQEAEANRYTKNETYTKEEVNNLITTPNQEYVSVTATEQTTVVMDVLPATGAADTTYRVGNWDGTQYNDSVFSEYAWNGSAYIKLSTKSQIGEVYDISANHADTKYADLAAALGTNGKNIPQSLRKGGMSIKFVQSSDNKYAQARLMANAFTTDVTQWQGVDDEPIAGSDNLVESGGVLRKENEDNGKLSLYQGGITAQGNIGTVTTRLYSEKLIKGSYIEVNDGYLIKYIFCYNGNSLDYYSELNTTFCICPKNNNRDYRIVVAKTDASANISPTDNSIKKYLNQFDGMGNAFAISRVGDLEEALQRKKCENIILGIVNNNGTYHLGNNTTLFIPVVSGDKIHAIKGTGRSYGYFIKTLPTGDNGQAVDFATGYSGFGIEINNNEITAPSDATYFAILLLKGTDRTPSILKKNGEDCLHIHYGYIDKNNEELEEIVGKGIQLHQGGIDVNGVISPSTLTRVYSDFLKAGSSLRVNDGYQIKYEFKYENNNEGSYVSYRSVSGKEIKLNSDSTYKYRIAISNIDDTKDIEPTEDIIDVYNPAPSDISLNALNEKIRNSNVFSAYKNKKIAFCGDSITQGAEAGYTSYATRVCNSGIFASGINKAVGGSGIQDVLNIQLPNVLNEMPDANYISIMTTTNNHSYNLLQLGEWYNEVDVVARFLVANDAVLIEGNNYSVGNNVYKVERTYLIGTENTKRYVDCSLVSGTDTPSSSGNLVGQITVPYTSYSEISYKRRNYNTDNTLRGYINKIMLYIHNNFPLAKVVWLTPIRKFRQIANPATGDDRNANGGIYLRDYCNVFMEVPTVWNAFAVDMWALSGLDPHVEEQQETWFNGVTGAVPSMNNGWDGVHPGPTGQYQLYMAFLGFLNSYQQEK